MADSQLGPLDKLFRDTNIAILVIFGICCNGIALILSLIAYFTAKDEKAKSNALITLIVSGILTVIGIVVQVAGVGAALMGAGAK